MTETVLMDATPLAGGHGQRGIGAAVRGLLEGFRALPADERPALLAAAPQPGFDTVVARLPAWPLGRVPLPDPWPSLAARRALSRRRPTVFHATQPAATPRGARLVATCYDLIPLHDPQHYLGGTRARAVRAAYQHYLARLREADLVIVPTQATGDDVTAMVGVDPGRVRVVPLGVVMPDGPAPRIAPGAPYVLYSGSLEPHKNVEVLIHALARSAHRDLRLVMTGVWSRRRRDDLRTTIEAAGVADRIDLCGHIPVADLARLRHGAAAVAVPSRREGFGLPALEAMAAAVPVVVSDAAALVEVTGGVCPVVGAGDVRGWTRALDELVGDPEARERAGAAGVAHARGYDWQRTAEAVRDAYREAADG